MLESDSVTFSVAVAVLLLLLAAGGVRVGGVALFSEK